MTLLTKTPGMSLDGYRPRRIKYAPFPWGQVAQLVEQRTENPRVGSSILPLVINQNINLRNIDF